MAANTGMHRLMISMLLIVAATASDYLTVEFTKTLDVAALTSATYTHLIKQLRGKVEHTHVHGVPNIPVLPVYNHKKPPQGFDVVLKDGAVKATARFRRDNLYLIGFQTPSGAWFEFGKAAKAPWYAFGKKKEQPPHLIKGSVFLGFDGDYPELEAIAGKVTGMEINHAKLIVSVRSLATSTDKKDRAKALLVVVQMISEAVRFIAVENHFASNLAKNAKLPEWMRSDLENNWAAVSKEVLKWDADTSYHIQPFTINGKRITTVAGLSPYVGILYHASATPRSTGLHYEM